MTWGVRDLDVRYGGRRGVSGVSLEVPRSSVTAVVGEDGAGKTTTLRALVGAVRPAAGQVRRPSARDIGYLPGAWGVYGDLTVRENLAFAGAAFGIRGPELTARAAALLERTGLAGAGDRLGGRLSGGMRQKLALAMAVLHRPALLVLDEPTTGVDPVSRAELWRLIAAAAADGAAVVFATTYLDEAERASSVLVLHGGSPLVRGTPEEIVAAVPGGVFEMDTKPTVAFRWRHGARWRGWSAEGEAPPGASAVTPTLEDAVTVAALAEGALRSESPAATMSGRGGGKEVGG